MSLTEKPINCEGYSLQISMKNLRLRDDHGNQNKDQKDNIDVSQNLKPEAKANNGDVLPQNKLKEVLETEMKTVSTSCPGQKVSKVGSQNHQKK